MFDSYNMLLKILNTNFSGISVESKDEGIVVSSVEEGRLAHVQGKQRTTKLRTLRKGYHFGRHFSSYVESMNT